MAADDVLGDDAAINAPTNAAVAFVPDFTKDRLPTIGVIGALLSTVVNASRCCWIMFFLMFAPLDDVSECTPPDRRMSSRRCRCILTQISQNDQFQCYVFSRNNTR
mmetsp:Transcript_22205/g.33914  ORF Transcript_22205/g.33914 Transcript_22205/m.33914 type:complete len:106 (+) Transcript_22205:834-1151(+)